jgi:hypothetical protein
MCSFEIWEGSKYLIVAREFLDKEEMLKSFEGRIGRR